MKIQYFESTDTLYMLLSERPVFETRDLDEDMQIDLDNEGNITAITLEHASLRARAPRLCYELKLWRGIARGEAAIAEGKTLAHAEARLRLARWLD